MPRSIEAIVNSALNHHAHLLSDMGEISRLPSGSVERRGFSKFSKMFCDSIIFWGLYNSANDRSRGTTIGRYVAEIRDVFNSLPLEVESVKLVQTGILGCQYDYFTREDRERHKSASSGVYMAGYIAIKVSLKDCRTKRIVPLLASTLPALERSHIVLHDIDITHDCRYISTREYIEKHLEANGVTDIIKDRNCVGDHCVSWRRPDRDVTNIRYKLYNKLVQMLESAEVRKSLGTRMEELVIKDGRFSRRLLRHKDHGFSRLELTFYGPKLLDLSEYQEKMHEARELLRDCITFKSSFEQQWKQRAKRIKSMVALYFPRGKVFVYCHWWNSVTSKKYGYMWKNVPTERIGMLLANYSFNDRSIHYFKVRVERDDTISFIKEKTYERIPGSTAITLVPGESKGMFPSRDAISNGARKFSAMGIVRTKNIAIAWPDRRYDARSPALADIIEVRGGKKRDGYINHLKISNSSMYFADATALRCNTQYTIVAAGMKRYRGDERWHFITECGRRVRGGKSLVKIWDKWRNRFVNQLEYHDINDVKWMTFNTDEKVLSGGIYHMKCDLA